jgi:hypothetical protein
MDPEKKLRIVKSLELFVNYQDKHIPDIVDALIGISFDEEEACEIKAYFGKTLKPCPFCGHSDDLHVTIHEVLCGNCSASVGSMCKTTEINRKIWNTRVHKK